MTPRYLPPSQQAIQSLISQYPLAWVISTQGSPISATPLPLLGNYDKAGRLLSLIGHIPKHNAHTEVLKHHSDVEILFQGPSGYLSPTWQSKTTWAPTYNYAVVQISAQLTFKPELTVAALNTLVDVMEAQHHSDWSTDQMGSRFTELSQGVIGFEAEVIDISARFKMGQDESSQTLMELLRMLGNSPLADYMRLCNSHRLPDDESS